MKCEKCGTEYEGNFCPNGCNSPYAQAKKKTPLYKKWWFWLIIVLVIIIVGAASTGDSDNNSSVTPATQNSSTVTQSSSAVEITYEKTDLMAMFDELEENALKAETKYQNKYVEVTGKITNFDSDGKYISIEPVNADAWNFDTTMCYIKNDTQRQFLMEKSKGDTVTIKGKITSIGEILGYNIDIHEVN